MYNRKSLSSGTGGGGLTPDVVAIDGTGTPYSLVAGKTYVCNNTQAWDGVLPAAPNHADCIEILDAARNFSTYNVSLDGGSKNLQDAGATTDVLSTDGIKVQIMFDSEVDEWITRQVS